MRLQLIMLILLGLGLVLVVSQNPGTLQQPVTFSIGQSSRDVLLRDVVIAFGAGWVLLWLAGLVDALALMGALRRHRTAVQEREHELARVKAEAYDRDRGWVEEVRTRLADMPAPNPAWTEEVRARLEAIDRGLREVRARLESREGRVPAAV